MKSFYKNRYGVIALLTLGLLYSSMCSAQRDKGKKDAISYFQSTEADSVLAADSIPVFRIQPGTELNIQVTTMNEEADALYNPRIVTVPLNSSFNPDTRQPAGYLVDAKGFINFPIVGRVKLLNLTTQEAADTLINRLSKQVNNPFVTVRVVNFQVTVLGEVGRPGVLNVSREKVTLPEAISLSGDLTIFGKRENVLVVRQQNGKREFGRVDLKDRSVFRSPYYYLQPNDMVYVEPKNSKKAQAGRVFPFLPTIFSGASLLVTIGVLVLRR
ncbi:polysaccharide export protein [Spirosoma taeanense]|uniref:Polysaccharide export protein n=1 Tax=Spirosoma taeanense TaxID=2735870 RepID=A0A6M5YAF6_9BACT|nr:polysaccharide biosynthesis/export family protein [Spirosoma taeanense]QJW91178.1 polysaccharide export protein [Spirosoma taeanense]